MKKIQKICLSMLTICLLMLVSGCGTSDIKRSAYTNDAVVSIENKTQDDTNGEAQANENKEEEVNHQDEAQTPSTTDTTENTKTQPQTDANKSDSSNNTQTDTPSVVPPTKKEMSVTISIDVHTISYNMDKLNPSKKDYVPNDGWILKPVTVNFSEGDTVFDVLEKITRERRIHMEYQGADQNIYNSVYIQGIAQLYEFDCGSLSGWMYSINGAYVSKGASATKLEDGMVIKWMYTCDLGRDLGFS